MGGTVIVLVLSFFAFACFQIFWIAGMARRRAQSVPTWIVLTILCSVAAVLFPPLIFLPTVILLFIRKQRYLSWRERHRNTLR